MKGRDVCEMGIEMCDGEERSLFIILLLLLPQRALSTLTVYFTCQFRDEMSE